MGPSSGKKKQCCGSPCCVFSLGVCAASWADRWTKSSWKQSDGTAGDFTLSAGKFYGDAEADKGIQTGPDSKFFATYAKLTETFDNTGKDLVLQVRGAPVGGGMGAAQCRPCPRNA